jgi:hypothetical protein
MLNFVALNRFATAHTFERCFPCKSTTYFYHKLPCHERQTCPKYGAAQKETQAEQEAASPKLWTRPPKFVHGVGVRIEKCIGCDYMMCKSNILPVVAKISMNGKGNL